MQPCAFIVVAYAMIEEVTPTFTTTPRAAAGSPRAAASWTGGIGADGLVEHATPAIVLC